MLLVLYCPGAVTRPNTVPTTSLLSDDKVHGGCQRIPNTREAWRIFYAMRRPPKTGATAVTA